MWAGFILCTAAFCFGVGYAVYNAKIFQIRDEDIQSNAGIDKSVRSLIHQKSLFNIDLAKLASVIMKEHPEYRKIHIHKLFPRTVRIDVDKREVFAQIKGRRFYPVDREAIVLSSGSTEAIKDLIPIEMQTESGSFHTGQRLNNDALEPAFELIENLNQNNFLNEFSVNLINITNQQNMYFFMQPRAAITEPQSSPEAMKVIVGEAGIAAKIKLLTSLIGGDLQDKLPLVKYIDLRHKKVYVGFQR